MKNIYLLLLNIASLSCTNFAHNYLTLKFKIVWDKIYGIYNLDLDGYTYILTMDKTGSESNYCKMQTIAKLQLSVGFECISVGFSRILWNSTFTKNSRILVGTGSFIVHRLITYFYKNKLNKLIKADNDFKLI